MSRLKPSRHLVVFALLVLAAGLATVSAVGQSEESDAAAEANPAPLDAPDADSAQAERGRYLVTSVAVCGECHTPRTESGDLQMSQWLHGAPVPVSTPEGYAPWAYKAPRIAGLPQHTDEEFVRLMTTGVNRDGQRTRFPMPQFRMTEDDALAIAAYLRSLP